MTEYESGYGDGLNWVRAMVSMLGQAASAEPRDPAMVPKLEATAEVCAELLVQIDQQLEFMSLPPAKKKPNGGTH